MNQIRKNVSFYKFVSGGAGMGLIKAIFESSLKRFKSNHGYDPNLPSILLSAPIVKSAFGIRGSTLHFLFSLPVNQQSGELRPLNRLNSDICNSLYSKLMFLKVLIIDEISMVGAKMFFSETCTIFKS